MEDEQSRAVKHVLDSLTPEDDPVIWDKIDGKLTWSTVFVVRKKNQEPGQRY
jgi:hypothetical protein